MVFHAAWQSRGYVEPGLTVDRPQASLILQTTALVMLTLTIALPVGVAVALIVFRSDVPGRFGWGLVILLPALLPMDLHATAWLAALGPQGLVRSIGLPIELKGLLGAAWVHAMASVSWIVAIVGAAVSTVEAELEEDCMLLVGPWRTLWHVTLRRSAGAVVAAALIVAVLTAGEMAVTDLLQVRTYAETVYTEFALASRVGAATATAIPGLAVWFALVVGATVLVARRVPQDTQALFARRVVFRLGAGRWISLAICALIVTATLGVPTTSLVWRAGLKFPARPAVTGDKNTEQLPFDESAQVPPGAHRAVWTPATFVANLWKSAGSASDQLQLSLMLAVLTALVTLPLAWLIAAGATRHRFGQVVAVGLACVLVALPGPVLGIGLALALNRPVGWWGSEASGPGELIAHWLARLSDSPAVLVWLHTLRALPFALAALWPALRVVNRTLVEAARTDGAGAWSCFWHVELPACWPAALACALLSSVLSIGELAGSVIVSPAGHQPLSVRIFTLAHYGVENHLAGICLVLLGVAALGSIAVLLSLRWMLQRLRE